MLNKGLSDSQKASHSLEAQSGSVPDPTMCCFHRLTLLPLLTSRGCQQGQLLLVCPAVDSEIPHGAWNVHLSRHLSNPTDQCDFSSRGNAPLSLLPQDSALLASAN